MTEILLIRHGETAWNTEKRLQGYTDIPLNAKGERQAAILGQALLHEPLDAIFTSDLQRALQTAQAIAMPRNMPVQIEPGLRERCFGAFEGLQHGEISERYPADYATWRAREPDARYPQGERVAETLREFSNRILSAVTRLVSQKSYSKIVLVTHGGVLDCMYRFAKEMDLSRPRDFDVLNAGINRLRWDGSRFHLMQWADVAHLDNSALDEIDR